MSNYENYARTAGSYDDTRVPLGLEIVLGCLARGGLPLADQHVLEAGCGTGNYLRALSPHVHKITGMDASAAMLVQARAKLQGDVALERGSILEMSFHDQSFNGVMCNQVIHHLDTGPGAQDDGQDWAPHDYANVRVFVAEAFRVLIPGSPFILNHSGHRQLTDGFWWADLIPEAVQRLTYRSPDISHLIEILRSAGFEIDVVTADVHGCLQGDDYLLPDGPLRDDWRAGDSTWALASAAEMLTAQSRVRSMIAADEMAQYLGDREMLRREIGQTTFVCARRPG